MANYTWDHVHLRTPDPEAMAQWFERMLGAQNANPVVLNNLAWLYHEAEDARALPTARRAYELAPEQPEIMDTYGWILLAESPGVELVLGQVSCPWKGVAAAGHVPTTPEQFSSFDEPGFAKIAASLRVDPRGSDSTILTLETRVALTDDTSRRRFKRYWLVIGPFSSLIRHLALRELATELRRSAA